MDTNFWEAMLASLVRKGMMTLATYLVTANLLQDGDKASFVNIGAGIVIGGAALAWDWWKNVGHAKLLAKVGSKP